MDAGDRGSLKAHNLRFGIGEAEFPAYGAVLDPKGQDLRCAIQIDRAANEGALNADSAFMDGGAVLSAQCQEAQEIRPDLVGFRGGAWPWGPERAVFTLEGGVQQFPFRRFQRLELLQRNHLAPHYPEHTQPGGKLCR